ncbi:hypothetical protein [Halomontanus rarus]|uniref:hypothetical protein n=1 Tax=Halomontanus rarus TaxID=3034020 RepID=UPI001A99C79C|nr:hypothetical protein [Halovivax sp. TS33]
MNSDRLRLFYLLGIALNVIALAFTLVDGETLLAPAFALVVVYLVIRYRMVDA